MTCESCGLVGHASSVEEARMLAARHEEQDLHGLHIAAYGTQLVLQAKDLMEGRC